MARPFEFSKATKQQAFARQWNKCAHCGYRLVDVYDHAHHVFPNQAGDPNNPEHAWIRGLDNCVILCDACHHRVHENGRTRNGAMASPGYFPYSYGREKARHLAWATRMQARFWKT